MPYRLGMLLIEAGLHKQRLDNQLDLSLIYPLGFQTGLTLTRAITNSSTKALLMTPVCSYSLDGMTQLSWRIHFMCKIQNDKALLFDEGASTRRDYSAGTRNDRQTKGWYCRLA